MRPSSMGDLPSVGHHYQQQQGDPTPFKLSTSTRPSSKPGTPGRSRSPSIPEALLQMGPEGSKPSKGAMLAQVPRSSSQPKTTVQPTRPEASRTLPQERFVYEQPDEGSAGQALSPHPLRRPMLPGVTGPVPPSPSSAARVTSPVPSTPSKRNPLARLLKLGTGKEAPGGDSGDFLDHH